MKDESRAGINEADDNGDTAGSEKGLCSANDCTSMQVLSASIRVFLRTREAAVHIDKGDERPFFRLENYKSSLDGPKVDAKV
jgi:hypothetical protein